MLRAPAKGMKISAEHESSTILASALHAERAASVEIDWDQFERCADCNGRAEIEETPDGNLICQKCQAQLPKPST